MCTFAENIQNTAVTIYMDKPKRFDEISIMVSPESSVW